MKGGETNPDAVAAHTATLQKKLDAYEKILSKKSYLAGDVIFFRYIVIFFLANIIDLVACHHR